MNARMMGFVHYDESSVTSITKSGMVAADYVKTSGGENRGYRTENGDMRQEERAG
jgi:hypothetical protein